MQTQRRTGKQQPKGSPPGEPGGQSAQGTGDPRPRRRAVCSRGKGPTPREGGQPTRGGQMNPHMGLNLTSGGNEPGENPGPKERTSQPREDGLTTQEAGNQLGGQGMGRGTQAQKGEQ